MPGTNNSDTVGTVTINHYINNGLTENYDPNTGWVTIQGNGTYGTPSNGFTVELNPDKKTGLNPVLYFKYIKSKFKVLERMRFDRRLKVLERAFYAAVDNGQDALGKKILNQLAVETREAAIYAKGIKNFIEREDLVKHKRKIRDGHISDTLIKDFTRVIPKDVLAKRDRVKDVFDDFVIYHYWNDKAQEKLEKKEKVNAEEKNKMRDPVLFGIVRETDRLYFVADWNDDHCDLTFSEMIDAIGKQDEDFELQDKPTLIK